MPDSKTTTGIQKCKSVTIFLSSEVAITLPQ